jgi:hypothetical protein
MPVRTSNIVRRESRMVSNPDTESVRTAMGSGVDVGRHPSSAGEDDAGWDGLYQMRLLDGYIRTRTQNITGADTAYRRVVASMGCGAKM